jgi:hypothetical protein
MINYTPQSQLSLELFKHPFEGDLDKNNRWVKMANLIPWDELASVYSKKLDSGSGRQSIDIRIVIASLIIKHKLRLDDRGTVQMIQENIYLQYFCGLKKFTTKPVFDPSLFVEIRKRLGGKEFDEFNRQVIDKSEKLVPGRSRIKRKHTEKDSESENSNKTKNDDNKGTLIVDATVADQEIKYPTDLNLLSQGREKLELIIDELYIPGSDGARPRTYRRVARKHYLNIAKKRRKGIKEIRRGVKVQLQYVRRNIKIVDHLLSKPGRLNILDKRDRELLWTIKKIYQQQKQMYDNKEHSCPNRIISLFQPHVRPIVRGKDKENTEFGAKINVSEVNGFCRIDRLNWDAYNESTDVKMQVERFRDLYGCYPKVFLGDSIYLTRENRKYLKDKGIEICGKPLGRPVKQNNQTAQEKYRRRKKAAERNKIEGKFGQAKRGYSLNNIKARLIETSESWINCIIFVMNLTKLLEIAEKHSGIFIFIFEKLKLSFISCTRTLSFLTNAPMMAQTV